MKDKFVQQLFSKFRPRKKGGTLYGTKHQRGRKKKNKGKKQRGGESIVKRQSPSFTNLMMSKMSEQIAPVAAAAMQKMIMEQLMGGR